MKPKISVVIPTHNRPDRVKRAIQSVLNQTFQDFEIIVVDDGVGERSGKAVKSFSDERIKYIQHKENQGGSAARNTGIKNSQADWVAFLDDDDDWLSKKLEKQNEIIKKYGEEIGYLFCGAYFRMEGKKEKRLKKPGKIGAYNFYKDIIVQKVKPYTPTLIVKKEILNTISGFDEDLPSNQEWELMFRVSKCSDGYAMPDILVNVNIQKKGHTGGNIKRRILGREILLQKHKEELRKIPKALSFHYYQLGDLYRMDGKQKKAALSFIKAWILDKTNVRALIKFLIFSMGFGKLIKLKNNG